VLKSSLAISHVNVELKTNVSEISSVFIIRVDVGSDHMPLYLSTLLMETNKISETLVFNSTLTWLIARENYSTFICHESFKSYIRFLQQQ
jgi:hypothetical protein